MNNLKLGSNNCFNEKRGELDFEGSEWCCFKKASTGWWGPDFQMLYRIADVFQRFSAYLFQIRAICKNSGGMVIPGAHLPRRWSPLSGRIVLKSDLHSIGSPGQAASVRYPRLLQKPPGPGSYRPRPLRRGTPSPLLAFPPTDLRRGQLAFRQ